MSKSGQTIGVVLMGLGVTAIVAIGAASVIKNIQSGSNKAQLQAAIDSLHLLAAQRVRSPAIVASVISSDQASNWLSLLACLRGAGTGCTSLASISSARPFKHSTDVTYNELNSKMSNRGGLCATGPSCLIERVASYRVNCVSATKCDGVVVTIETSYLGTADTAGGRINNRSTVLDFSGADLVGNVLVGSLNWSCAQDASNPLPITQFDAKSKIASCAGIANPNCVVNHVGAGRKLAGIAGSEAELCLPLEDKTCEPKQWMTGFGLEQGGASCEGMSFKPPCDEAPEEIGGFVLEKTETEWKILNRSDGTTVGASCRLTTWSPPVSNTSFFVPADVKEIYVQAWGGGGGGNNGWCCNNSGSPGAFVGRRFVTSGGERVTVVVGQGGAGLPGVSQCRRSPGNGGDTTVTVQGVDSLRAGGGRGGAGAAKSNVATYSLGSNPPDDAFGVARVGNNYISCGHSASYSQSACTADSVKGRGTLMPGTGNFAGGAFGGGGGGGVQAASGGGGRGAVVIYWISCIP